MKQRFSSLDVKVIAHELASALVTLRVQNIYSLSSTILLIKFAKPNHRKHVIIESGFRVHLTDWARSTTDSPTQFVSRLRKTLKTRRVTAVSQIGSDRVLEFQFSDDKYRLYLEFFASGNVILTDAGRKILALLRNVPEGDGQERLAVGLVYSLENRQNVGGVPDLTKQRLRDALKLIVERETLYAAAVVGSGDAGKKPKKKKKEAEQLRRGLATTITEFPPALVEHALFAAGFDGSAKPADVLDDGAQFDALFEALRQHACKVLDGITNTASCKGYIVAKPRPAAASSDAQPEDDAGGKNLLYEDFHPFRPKQFDEDGIHRILTFDNYNKTVDDFFSSVEGQKLDSRVNEREAAAKRKLENVHDMNAQRIQGLQNAQALHLRKAGAIEANVERVQEAIIAVKSLLDQGMDWVDLGKLIERERKHLNPVATIITKLALEKDEITLFLKEEEWEEEEEEEPFDFDYETDENDDSEEPEPEPKPEASKGKSIGLEVEIDLHLSAWNNAREYYLQKRSAAEKQLNTEKISSVALQSAEKKIGRDLKAGLKKEKPGLQVVRKPMVFEKYFWFCSSDGYLVLGGREDQQNEMLYRRYLRRGDVYVHADVKGAPVAIVKNNPKSPDAPIPPSTVIQAGAFVVAASEAWDSKAGMGAWWVYGHQVTKSTGNGDFLPIGSFAVRGEKQFLPPSLLVVGFGLMFKIGGDGSRRHRIYDIDPVSASATTEGVVGQEDNEDAASGAETDRESDDDMDADTSRGGVRNPLQPGEGESHDDDDDEGAPSEKSDEAEPLPDQVASLQLDEEESTPESQSKEETATPSALTEKVEDDDDDDEEEEEKEEEEEADSGSPLVVVTPSRSETPSTSSPAGQQAAPKQKQAPHKRGQKSKAKKIAKKYKDQDEEDRALMESLLGTTAGRERAEAEAASRAAREAGLAQQVAVRRMHRERQMREVAEHEEVRQRMLGRSGGGGGSAAVISGDGQGDKGPHGDGDDTGHLTAEELDEEVLTALAQIQTLVGTPQPGDEIVEAVPVCAPWAALARVKYKVKLQPGSVKRGKAAREIVERWQGVAATATAGSGSGSGGSGGGSKGTGNGAVDQESKDTERIWPREAELIKGLRSEEAVNCLPVGRVTVVQAGGLASGGGAGKGGKGGKGGRGGKGSKKR